MNIYVVCAVIGAVATFAFARGWNKIGITGLVLFGVMLALTAIGPNLQHGVSTGVDSALITVKSFFN